MTYTPLLFTKPMFVLRVGLTAQISRYLAYLTGP